MNIVFDFDGTLYDGHSASFGILRSLAYDVMHIDIKKNDFFSSPEEMIKYYIESKYDISAEVKKVLLEKYREELFEVEDLRYLYSDISIILDELVRRNDKLFILSDRDTNRLSKLINRLKLDSYFIEVVGRDKFGLKPASGKGLRYLINKYELVLGDTVFIGDSFADYLTANYLGVCYIQTNYSHYNTDSYKISDQGKIVYANKPKELINIIDEIMVREEYYSNGHEEDT